MKRNPAELERAKGWLRQWHGLQPMRAGAIACRVSRHTMQQAREELGLPYRQPIRLPPAEHGAFREDAMQMGYDKLAVKYLCKPETARRRRERLGIGPRCAPRGEKRSRA